METSSLSLRKCILKHFVAHDVILGCIMKKYESREKYYMNILLLALSTYPYKENLKYLKKHHQLERNFMNCTDRESFEVIGEDYGALNFFSDQKGKLNYANIFSYHTDEPGTKAVINACGNLDVMILMVSDAVLKPFVEGKTTKYGSSLKKTQANGLGARNKFLELTFQEGDEESEVNSSFDLYIEQIRHYLTCVGIQFPKVYVLRIEDELTALQVNNYCIDVTRLLIDFEHEMQETCDSVNLYLEINGGPRETIAILIGTLRVVSNNHNIKLISAVYSIYDRNKKSTFRTPYQIVEKRSIYQFMDLVSGIDDFKTSGQSERLIRYFNTINKNLPSTLHSIQNLSNAFLLCQPNGIIEAMKEVVQKLKEEAEHQTANEEYDKLYYFILEEIRNDLGNEILEISNSTKIFDMIIPIVNWSLKKGYFQQALTLCAEKMPDVIVNKHILYYSQDRRALGKEDRCIFSDLQKLESKCEYTSEYIFIQQYLCVNPNSRMGNGICYQNLYTKVQWEEDPKWKNQPDLNKYYVNCAYSHGTYIRNVLETQPALKCQKIYTKLKNMDDVIEILREYYSIKKLRDTVNHASTNLNKSGEFYTYFSNYKNYEDTKKYLHAFITNVTNAIHQISGEDIADYPITPISEIFK